MAGPSYALAAHLHASLPAGALVALPRSIDLTDVPSSTFRLRSHGLAAGDLFTFEARGASAVVAPPISQVQLYSAVPVSADLFTAQLAGGGPLVLSGPPTGLLAIVIDLAAVIATTLAWWSRQLDQALTAHLTPLVPPYPDHATQLVCYLAAYDLLIGRGLLNPEYAKSADVFKGRGEWAKGELDRYRVGVPMVGAIDQSPTTPDNAATAWSDPSAPDWNAASVIP
jgi:hypothetical protein